MSLDVINLFSLSCWHEALGRKKGTFVLHIYKHSVTLNAISRIVKGKHNPHIMKESLVVSKNGFQSLLSCLCVSCCCCFVERGPSCRHSLPSLSVVGSTPLFSAFLCLGSHRESKQLSWQPLLPYRFSLLVLFLLQSCAEKDPTSVSWVCVCKSGYNIPLIHSLSSCCCLAAAAAGAAISYEYLSIFWLAGVFWKIGLDPDLLTPAINTCSCVLCIWWTENAVFFPSRSGWDLGLGERKILRSLF